MEQGVEPDTVDDKNENDIKNVSISSKTKSVGDSVESKLSNMSILQKLPVLDVMDGNELLGSVTVTPTTGPDNNQIGQTVRTSARVIQKMKLDSIRPQSPVAQDKKDQTKDERSGPKTPNQTKPNRNVWSNTEKNFFFDALNEYGKDFDSISHYVNTKSKRKNSLDITFKSREQIRLFYYQSYQKISKYLKFSDDVKKLAQELYALINYGEMRKKLLFINEKSLMKLRDLVYKGWVTLRVKGKNVKIKTPSCKALRQLNQLEEWQEEIKLPPRIEINVKPANLITWGRVQNLAQNPRVKMTLPIQRRVSCLIKTLQNKWKNSDLRLCEKSMTMQSQSTSNLNKNSRTKLSHNESDTNPNDSQQNHLKTESKIRILPPTDIIIHRPMVNLTEFLSSNKLCLNSYEDRIGVKVKGEMLCSERINTLKELKLNSKRPRHDSNSEKKSPETKKNKIEFDIRPLEPCEKLEKILTDSAVDMNKSIDEEIEEKYLSDTDELKLDSIVMNIIENDSKSINNTTNELNIKTEPLKEIKIEDVKSIKVETKKRDKTNASNKTKKELRKESGTYRPLINEETIKKIREGWTLTNIGDMTFGDLYVMFGSDLKLNLEYVFVDDKENTNYKNSTIEITSNIIITNTALPEFNSIKTIKLPNLKDKVESSIGNKLKSLLLIANLSEHKKKKSICLCGHVCDHIGNRLKKNDDFIGSFISSKNHFASQNDNALFRPPALPNRNNIPVIETYKQLNVSNRLKQPRWLKVRNKTTFPSKQVVVQRLLPLQPGMSPTYDPINSKIKIDEKQNQNDDKNDNNKILDEKIIDDSKKLKNSDNNIWKDLKSSTIVGARSSSSSSSTSSTISSSITSTIQNNLIESKPSTSTTTVTTEFNTNENNQLLDIPELDNSQSTFIKNLHENIGFKSLMDITFPSPIRFDCDNARLEAFINATPPMSPMKLLKEMHDSQQTDAGSEWLTPDLNDFSFSSFLGHLDLLAENSRKSRNHSQNMDSNLSVMSESSVDYMTKFAQIAAEMKEQENALN